MDACAHSLWHGIGMTATRIWQKECVMSFMFLSVLDSQLRLSWSSIMTAHCDWSPTPTVTGGIRDSSSVCRNGSLDHGWSRYWNVSHRRWVMISSGPLDFMDYTRAQWLILIMCLIYMDVKKMIQSWRWLNPTSDWSWIFIWHRINTSKVLLLRIKILRGRAYCLYHLGIVTWMAWHWWWSALNR